MLHEEPTKKREQISLACIVELVPQNHLLRKIDRVIDWSFIYDLVKEKYSPDFGRPSIDPVILIKIVLIQYLYGIRSMRQTIREIEVNLAYRWFLGLGMYEKVPHFSTFGKNYTRRFKGTDLFEQIFTRVLQECIDAGLVDPSEVFIDATHVHHIVPVSQIGLDYVIDPLKDLIPVCPNCHSMLHRKDPPLIPEELKRIVEDYLESHEEENDR